jgi:hypothetical protein
MAEVFALFEDIGDVVAAEQPLRSSVWWTMNLGGVEVRHYPQAQQADGR